MSLELISRIEGKLKEQPRLDEQSRQEMLDLLSALKAEMQQLAGTHDEHLESIAGFAGVAAHEAMRAEQNPALLRFAVDGLSMSGKELEAEHPRLTETANGICTMLANIGI